MKERFKAENSHSARNLELLEIVTQPATEQLARAASPRFVKTHLPMSLLPPNLLNTGRVVYVARDPRDVAVSFYHLNRLIRTQGYLGDFKTYWKFFIKDLRKFRHFVIILLKPIKYLLIRAKLICKYCFCLPNCMFISCLWRELRNK